MIEQAITQSILLQLLVFIAWSAMLYGAALVAARLMPELVKWSRFWQAWLVIAFAPLLPISYYSISGLIPPVLSTVLLHSNDNLSKHSSAVLNSIVSQSGINSVLYWLLAMVFAGCVFSLARFFLGIIKVNQFFAQAEPSSEQPNFSPKQAAMIARRRIQVSLTQQAVSPFVFGFFKPRMLLPHHVLAMPAARQFLLIEHELTHITRHDHQAVIIFRLAAACCWFNPFIKLFEQRFLQSMELNCDNQVLERFPEHKLNYAQALIASLKLSANPINNRVTTYFCAPNLTKQDYEQRIRMVMSMQARKVYGLGYRLNLIVVSLLFMVFAIALKPGFDFQKFDDHQQVLPVANARISSGFDDVSDFRGRKPHLAIDFAAPVGTAVVASFSGQVTIADASSLHKNYGKVVLIEHRDGKHSVYAHLDSFKVNPGQWVSAGQSIGTVGMTGRVTGPHLHFELLENGKRIDPSLFLDLTTNYYDIEHII